MMQNERQNINKIIVGCVVYEQSSPYYLFVHKTLPKQSSRLFPRKAYRFLEN